MSGGILTLPKPPGEGRVKERGRGSEETRGDGPEVDLTAPLYCPEGRKENQGREKEGEDCTHPVQERWDQYLPAEQTSQAQEEENHGSAEAKRSSEKKSAGQEQPSQDQSQDYPGRPSSPLSPNQQIRRKRNWNLLHLFGSRWAFRLLSLSPSSTFGQCRFFFKTKKPVVCLTIDDGPGFDDGVSFELLDLLKESGVKGTTFFLISSQIAGREHVVKRLLDDGHEIGNHLVKDAPADTLSEAEFESELLAAEGDIAAVDPSFASAPLSASCPPVLSSVEAEREEGERNEDQGGEKRTQRKMKWFRPPSAATSKPMMSVLKKHGYTPVLGDVHPIDGWIDTDRGFLSSFVLRHSKPGSILILHWPSRHFRRHCLDILKDVLPSLTSKFDVLSLSQLHEEKEAENEEKEKQKAGTSCFEKK
uniref:NodB homology domain-containing protein n=1 Tax=Chromera velia CCMP2878 TaxID=1169474 RepID=A0A0G4HIT9_9ALVE|eukprot:Cvel_27923.t1-p1 / transcript=Cvel_27923.t1 / gene=Cvel_27923 / organism=Chromera_velia_CCMP2878 / gene_product=hypothetical protein / transcript_product=hypothetical protein / location=Cvel_scaffold3559:723-3828(+) / protein_length=418 / sequence_SO=supercontig / SO=protein_coding / is_pseudo=false